MNFIIAGAGYTGLRVAEELSKSDTCLVSRNFDQDIQFKIQKINLDSNSNKIKTDPKNPNSSEKRVKIKSVCFSGKKSR